MSAGRMARLAALGMLTLILASAVSAMAATNTVPRTGAGEDRSATTANSIKPGECAGLGLTNRIVRTGNATGTNANDLMLGGGAADTLDGSGGDDCVVGGGGNDRLDGGTGGGNDVLIGGPGDDVLDGGGGNDFCYGGPGNDTFRRCQNSVQ